MSGHISLAFRGPVENERVQYGTEVKAVAALMSSNVEGTRMLDYVLLLRQCHCVSLSTILPHKMPSKLFIVISIQIDRAQSPKQTS